MPWKGQRAPVATVRETAVVPVGLVREKRTAPRLIVEVRKFEPSADDDVEILVELKGGGSGPAVVGRFTMYPNAKFVAPSPADSQRFQFPISPGDAGRIVESGVVVVRLHALRGTAESASIELGAATLELPETGQAGSSKGG